LGVAVPGGAASGGDADVAGSDDTVDVSSPELAALEADRDEMRQSMRYSALRTAEANQRGHYLGMNNKAPLVDAAGRPLRPPRAFASAHLRPWKRVMDGRSSRGGFVGGCGSVGAGPPDGSGDSGDAADGDGELYDVDGSTSPSDGKAASSASSGASLEGAAGSSPRSCVRCPANDSDTLGKCRCERLRAADEVVADAAALPPGVGRADGAAARSAPRDVPTAAGGGVPRGGRLERAPCRRVGTRERNKPAADAAGSSGGSGGSGGSASSDGDGAAAAAAAAGDPGATATVIGLTDEWSAWQLTGGAPAGIASDGDAVPPAAGAAPVEPDTPPPALDADGADDDGVEGVGVGATAAVGNRAEDPWRIELADEPPRRAGAARKP